MSCLSDLYFDLNWKKISIDSRTLEPGDIFLALRGFQMSGEQFVEQAFLRSAAAAIVSTNYPESSDTRIIRVPSVQQALWQLAETVRQAMHIPIVGITGSVGKTTHKRWLASMLETLGLSVYAGEKNYNNAIGLPLTLAKMPPESAIGVFEIGTSAAGEILPLARLVSPTVGILTRIGFAHMAHFPSFEALLEEKSQLIEGITPQGHMILQGDQPYYPVLQAKAKTKGLRCITVGHHPQADVQCVGMNQNQAQLRIGHQIFSLKLSHPLMLEIGLSLLGACLALEQPIEESIKALENCRPTEGRGECLQLTFGTKIFLLMDDSYNANPLSMRSMLQYLFTFPAKRFFLFLSNMAEQKNPEEEQKLLAQHILSLPIAGVWTHGLFQEIMADALQSRHLGSCNTAEEALKVFLTTVEDGDIIAIKGASKWRLGEWVSFWKAQADQWCLFDPHIQ